MNSNLQKKAIKHAKKQVRKHEGHGLFSSDYYLRLFDKYVEQFIAQVLK